MSENQRRDEGGRFAGKVTEQDILKIFDRVGEPMTAPELAEELPITADAVTYRLKKMKGKGLVDRKRAGANAVVWWAEVAPELSEEAKRRVEEAEKDIEEGNTVPLEEV